MAITTKQRDAIADALPQLLKDALGWVVRDESDSDVVEELANELVASMRTFPDWAD